MNQNVDRRKVIIVTIIMGVLLLGVIVLAIVSLVNKGKPAETTPVVAEKTTVDDSTLEEKPSKDLQPVENTESTSTVTVEPTVATNLPDTGPMDFLPIAMIAGSATAYALSRKKSLMA